MPKVKLYNIAGQETGEIELNDSVFGVDYNEAVIHQAVVRQMANERLGTHATKTRGLVRGGGKKPWKQKGTGRARVGSIRSPLWVGGGTVFGPTPRSHAKDMPRKARPLAPKTKNVVKMLADLHSEGKALIVDGARNTVLSARNIPGVKAYAPSGLNIYDIVNTDKLFLTQEAVKKIEEVLA